ncbi:MAG: EF-P lysine aminoacylase EpmA [Aureliella sp.]
MANDWRPVATAANLQRRAEIVWQIREFFHARGYAEVHTPTISADTVVDRYIDPVVLPGRALGCASATAEQYYLQTSPEFCMKRLLASGMQAIYQLGPAYRAGERGQFHNPEFTMLEWYRVGETLDQAVAFLGELARTVFSGRIAQRPDAEAITYQEAFLRTLGIDPLNCSIEDLKGAVSLAGLPLGGNWQEQSRDDWLNLLFAECVQPQLGRECPQVVTHYPHTQAALAAISPSDPRTAERYELFVDGVELANGYHELLDPEELTVRSERVLYERRADGKLDLPLTNRLQMAMQEGLPDACGCALGVDRLVMVALGIDSIDEVIAFPIERA